MLFIVKVENQEILAKWDAWQSDCMECAKDYTEQNGLDVVKQEITFMGDLVWWVR